MHGGSRSGGRADGHIRGTGLPELLQLLHRQGGQGVEVQLAVEGLDIPNHGGLAHGDAAALGLGLQPGVHTEDLTEDGSPGRGIFQGSAHLGGQVALQAGGPLGVIVLHGDQNGGGQPVQIAVLQQGAHNGVDRHLQLGALQVHAVQDYPGVLI